MSMQIEEPSHKVEKTFSLFALGFRSFFLLAGFSAIILIIIWLLLLSGKVTFISYYSSIGWHAHEMLFGYAAAVVAGFLLTAAGNWTGIKMLHGWRLMLLSLVWLMARIFPFISEVPQWYVALSDLIFFPLVALIIAIPVIRTRQWPHLIFIPLLLLMAVANLIVHLNVLQLSNLPAMMGNKFMLYLLIIIIVVMGGRVIPFFTERGIPNVTTRKWAWIERLVPASIILLALSDVFYGDKTLTGYFAIFAAVVNAVRLAGWYSNKIWTVPLVWILQLAYAWIIIGFMIKSAPISNFSMVVLSYHALTVGGIGMMTLGMMARISLGHTGREIKINKGIVLAFILINLATIFRVILPLFIQGYYMLFVNIAGYLWIMAFTIFVIIYTPMWINPRVDGREG